MAAIAKDGVLNKLPIIVILGATGTGKSKLALQVAKRFNGEIISADAMQVYRGLDIVTNKVTAEEMKEVPHHMLDYLSPGQPSKVTDFRDKALPIIENLRKHSRTPVIAGGTCYYVESLLYKVLMDVPETESELGVRDGALRPPEEGEPPAKKSKTEESVSDSGCGVSAKCRRVREVLKEVLGGLGGSEMSACDVLEGLSSQEKAKLHHTLEEVDPERAAILHPNNVRKIVRSLQVFERTGRLHSEMIHQQKTDGTHLGGPLRYPNSVILWVTCQQDVLDARLDSRVDEMISQGLIKELEDFHKEYNLHRTLAEDGTVKQPAYTLGIFQSIGFKEFHDYLMLSEEERQSAAGQCVFKKGLDLMKLATRQYARRQLKWIRKRFLGRCVDQTPPVYALDGTEASNWDISVRDKAYSIVQSVFDNTPCAIQPEPHNVPTMTDHTLKKCEQCDRLFHGKEQLEVHLKSEKHKRQLKRLAKVAGSMVTKKEVEESGKDNTGLQVT